MMTLLCTDCNQLYQTGHGKSKIYKCPLCGSTNTITPEKDNLDPPFFPMHTILSEVSSGEFELKKKLVTEKDNDHNQMMSIFTFSGREYCGNSSGYFMVLQNKGWVIMSDTHMERRSNYEFVTEARGDVLVGGLGIGFVIVPLLNKPDVSSITVIEKEKDIIDMIWPQLLQYQSNNEIARSKKMYVICGDVFNPTESLLTVKGYQYVYVDIWPEISGDNWEEMKKAKKALKKFVDYKHGGVLRCWREDEVKRMSYE